MIGKDIKVITLKKEDYILDITLNEIEAYLTEIKDAIQKDRYRIELNSHRQNNRDLFFNYIFDETMAKKYY